MLLPWHINENKLMNTSWKMHHLKYNMQHGELTQTCSHGTDLGDEFCVVLQIRAGSHFETVKTEHKN